MEKSLLEDAIPGEMRTIQEESILKNMTTGC
jgi:hypothetical protein